MRAGTILDPEHGDQNDCGDERLVVRWKTEARTESGPFHESRPLSASSAQHESGRSQSEGKSKDGSNPPENRSSLSLTSSKNGTNRGLSVLLGGEEPIFKLSKEEQFTGLFIFSFDEEGRILTHTIEHADEANGWDRTAKFVTLTDWLIGKARGSLDPVSNTGLAIECNQDYDPSAYSHQHRRRCL